MLSSRMTPSPAASAARRRTTPASKSNPPAPHARDTHAAPPGGSQAGGNQAGGGPAGSRSLPAVAIVVSSYNASITDVLLAGAQEAYVRRGGDAGMLEVVRAPGAFELTALSHAAASTGRFAGVCALGCIIRGETSHDRYIAEAVAQGLTSVTILTGRPVAFGVLTVDTPAQARARAGGAKGNKGAEAMDALLDTLDAIVGLHDGRHGGRHSGSTAGSTSSAAKPDKAAGAVGRAGSGRAAQAGARAVARA